MAEIRFKETLQGMLSNMEGYLDTKSVVGEAIHLEDGTTLIPLVDVSFGVAAGCFGKDTKNKAGGGMGAKMTPNAVLVVKDGMTRMVSIKDQDTISRLTDMIPDVINRLSKLFGKKEAEEVVIPDETVTEMAEELLHP